MIKSIDEMPRVPIEIDLTGPEGNVYYLLGLARNLAKQCFTEDEDELLEEITLDYEMKCLDMEFYDPKTMGDLICKKMRSSDYENALTVFDSYFGSIVTLYR